MHCDASAQRLCFPLRTVGCVLRLLHLTWLVFTGAVSIGVHCLFGSQSLWESVERPSGNSQIILLMVPRVLLSFVDPKLITVCGYVETGVKHVQFARVYFLTG